MSKETNGSMIRRRREALGWTLADLASRARITGQQVANIEVGRTRKPHRLTMDAIEQALVNGERDRADG